MMARILLIDHDERGRRSVRGPLRALGHELLVAEPMADPLDVAGEEPPDAVILNMDLPGDRAMELCRNLRRREGTRDVPILALSRSRGLGQAEELFREGVSAYLSKPFSGDALCKKVDSLLYEESATGPGGLDVPKDLAEIFDRLRNEAGRLGHMAEIFSGVSPRAPTYRRNARPGPGWQATLTADCLSRFVLRPPQLYFRFDRTGLLRLPPSEEYDQPEKVVLQRTGPPLTAAVDTHRHPIASDLYAVVPAKGLECGFLAGLLNSRLVDFYFNRIRPIQSAPGGSYLRRVDLEAIPVVLPPKAEQIRCGLYVKALAGLDPRPRKADDLRQRQRLLNELNAAIFDAYGLDDAAVQRLDELHF